MSDLRHKRILACTDGASAVEFALLVPFFIALMFGIVAYGSWLATAHGVQQLAAEAARSSVAGLSETERVSLARDYVTANVGSYPLIAPANLTIEAASSGGTAFVVTARYDASDMFIYSVLPQVVTPPSTTITRSAVVPYGGF